jgi:hypothetical protein
LAYYRGHAHNRCVLLVRQDRVVAEQHIREASTWRARRLFSATAKLTIPEVGLIGLVDLYEATPPDPFPRKAA